MIEIICDSCAYAADRNKPGLHEMCKSPATCGCQHHAVGYGRVVLPAQVTLVEAEPVVTEIGLSLDESRHAALESTGLSLGDLAAKIQNWEADGHELMVWRILQGEAA